jgi:hypothetical protein
VGFTEDLLDEIRAEIAPSDTVLAEARERLKLTRKIAELFPGALRTYASGSLPQFTVNHPVSDADGGVVLDRRSFPHLGPDGDGEAPSDVVAELCALLGPGLREFYDNAVCRTSKRGPKLYFGAPLEDQDPTVDLVCALTRRDADGLWIPNLETDTWEASDPEKHVELLNSGTVALLRVRRRVVRLAKAWNKQFVKPGFSSHNLSMIALEAVTGGENLADALAGYFAHAAQQVAEGDTRDPAGVSKDIPLLIPRDDAVARLNRAAEALADALAHDDDETEVRSALARVYWKYVDDPAAPSLGATVTKLHSAPITTSLLGLAGPVLQVRPTRAYGC